MLSAKGIFPFAERLRKMMENQIKTKRTRPRSKKPTTKHEPKKNEKIQKEWLKLNVKDIIGMILRLPGFDDKIRAYIYQDNMRDAITYLGEFDEYDAAKESILSYASKVA